MRIFRCKSVSSLPSTNLYRSLLQDATSIRKLQPKMADKPKPIFSKRSFWSDNLKELNVDTDGDYMIARVFDAGTFLDMQEAIRYYGKERIKKALLDAADLTESAIAHTAIWLDLKPTQYRSHNRRSQNPIQHPSF